MMLDYNVTCIAGVPKVPRSDAETLTNTIKKLIEDSSVKADKIIGLVFDTTNTNSGNISGIALRLENWLSKNLLKLACRHHIAELICGEACTIVYGKTDSPNEDVFKSFAAVWPNLCLSEFTVPIISGRWLISLKKDVEIFLRVIIDKKPYVKIIRS